MAYRDIEKRKAYCREYQKRFHKKHKKYNVKRRKYFREYNRRNKIRLKMMALIGGATKLIASNKILCDSIVDKTELMRKEQVKLDIKINQIKKFVNIK